MIHIVILLSTRASCSARYTFGRPLHGKNFAATIFFVNQMADVAIVNAQRDRTSR
jgi:hypothetical protein